MHGLAGKFGTSAGVVGPGGGVVAVAEVMRRSQYISIAVLIVADPGAGGANLLAVEKAHNGAKLRLHGQRLGGAESVAFRTIRPALIGPGAVENDHRLGWTRRSQTQQRRAQQRRYDPRFHASPLGCLTGHLCNVALWLVFRMQGVVVMPASRETKPCASNSGTLGEGGRLLEAMDLPLGPQPIVAIHRGQYHRLVSVVSAQTPRVSPRFILLPAQLIERQLSI